MDTNSKNEEKVNLMLSMQDQLNRVVNPNWMTAGFNWDMAITDEGTELLNHYGWKWWKAFSPDVPQCRLELVDIFHFILSKGLVVRDQLKLDMAQAIARVCFEDVDHVAKTPEQIRLDIMKLVHISTGEKSVNSIMPLLFAFRNLCADFELTLDEVFKLYVQKNTLNLFRQANGYKQGTYIKIWDDGREDNEHLTEICQSMDFNNPDCVDSIKAELQVRYSKNKGIKQ